jgi:hypothetical protein
VAAAEVFQDGGFSASLFDTCLASFVQPMSSPGINRMLDFPANNWLAINWNSQA